MAIGAMRFIKEIGFKIPDDISIVGYDDIKISSYISPSLTTVGISMLEMASIAVKNLIKFIEKDIVYPKYNTITTNLVLRESSRRINLTQA
jgi:DNA-binding LacI/PurR family transcriptional regulator